MLRQPTCGEDFDLLIDASVAVNVSTLLLPKDSGVKRHISAHPLDLFFANCPCKCVFVV